MANKKEETPAPIENEAETPVAYEEFRTGLTFCDVYRMIWSRMWKRRKGVLGSWREIKRKMYNAYLWDFWKRQEKKERSEK